MKTFIKYVITAAIGLGIGLWVLISQDFFSLTTPLLKYGLLADAFYVPGIILTGVGLLVFVTNEGVFDGLNYAVRSFIGMFRKNIVKYNSLYDYRESKGREKYSFGYIVLCGLFFLILSFAFYMVWLSYRP